MRLISISRGSRSGPQFRSARSASGPPAARSTHHVQPGATNVSLARPVIQETRFQTTFCQISQYFQLMYAILRQTALCYYRSADLRFLLGRHQRHQEGIAFTAVHELSHALWERLEGQPLDKKWSGTSADWEKFSLLVEGYAEYAHQIWFWICTRRVSERLCAIYDPTRRVFTSEECREPGNWSTSSARRFSSISRNVGGASELP